MPPLNPPTGPQVKTLLDRMGQEKLIGIVRTDSADSALWAATQLLDAGLRMIEIPLTVPEAPRVIESLSDRYPQALIGAGTVLEVREAVESLAAGAQFLVSPVMVENLVSFGLERDVLFIPGCMTPTEMFRADVLGSPAVKFFPAGAAGGPGFIQAFKGPLPHVPIIPTGGIQLEQVAEYLGAGALAVGVGGPLIPKPLLEALDESALRQHARQYLSAAQRLQEV